MTAVLANVLRVAPAPGDEHDAVRPEEAVQRVSNHPLASRALQEAVAAAARILDKSIPFRHRGHTVTQEPARIAHFLREPIAAVEAISVCGKHQGMSAAYAHILVNAVTLCEKNVGVVSQEAGQGVADVSRTVCGEVLDATTASPDAAGFPAEQFIIDDMSPEGTTQTDPQRRDGSLILHTVECEIPARIGSRRLLSASARDCR